MEEPKFDLLDAVEKYTGDAQYRGVIVAIYKTTKGKLRYVVEVEPQGFQMITAEKFLRRVTVT